MLGCFTVKVSILCTDRGSSLTVLHPRPRVRKPPVVKDLPVVDRRGLRQTSQMKRVELHDLVRQDFVLLEPAFLDPAVLNNFDVTGVRVRRGGVGKVWHHCCGGGGELVKLVFVGSKGSPLWAILYRDVGDGKGNITCSCKHFAR